MRVEIAPPPITLTVGPEAETVELWPQRAVYWPAAQTLMVADLHWGKGETFRHHGIPIPGGILDADLDRLNAAVAATGADRLIFLGDLIHGRHGLTPALLERISQWRSSEAAGLDLILVRGNHDRHCKRFPESWQIEVRSDVMTEGPFAFAHHPQNLPDHFTWAGHIHPAVQLSGRSDSLRLPCFHIGSRVGVLPAFGSFTGGCTINRQPGERIFAVVEAALMEV